MNTNINYKYLFSKNYFQVRLDHAKWLNATPALDEKIELYNMTEDVFWRDLDRYMRGLNFTIN